MITQSKSENAKTTGCSMMGRRPRNDRSDSEFKVEIHPHVPKLLIIETNQFPQSSPIFVLKIFHSDAVLVQILLTGPKLEESVHYMTIQCRTPGGMCRDLDIFLWLISAPGGVVYVLFEIFLKFFGNGKAEWTPRIRKERSIALKNAPRYVSGARLGFIC